jgi:hypothetical protein
MDPKIARKAEEALRKLGAVLAPLVARGFMFEHGEALAAGGDFWEAIDAYRVAHPEKFGRVDLSPEDREKSGEALVEAIERVATQNTKTLLRGLSDAKKPEPVDLTERRDDGSFRHDLDRFEQDTLRQARRDSE